MPLHNLNVISSGQSFKTGKFQNNDIILKIKKGSLSQKNTYNWLGNTHDILDKLSLSDNFPKCLGIDCKLKALVMVFVPTIPLTFQTFNPQQLDTMLDYLKLKGVIHNNIILENLRVQNNPNEQIILYGFSMALVASASLSKAYFVSHLPQDVCQGLKPPSFDSDSFSVTMIKRKFLTKSS